MGKSFGANTGGSKHGKSGSSDKGRGGNIDKHGNTGKHHGGFLGGSSKGKVEKDFWGNVINDDGPSGGGLSWIFGTGKK